MSFIGIVTRKEQDTGVTLEAKIVTPNKKKAIKQKFKVKVKKTGLTDYECCVLDYSIVRNKLISQHDLSAVKEDINLIYNGEYGTTITYSIEDTGIPKLSDHLGSDGKILKRPKYGQNDASGYIVISVKKGNTSISNMKIRTTVKQIMEQEVLNSEGIKDNSLWNAIKGKNAAWSTVESTSGHKNIFHNLNLITNSNQLLDASKMIINSLSIEPVTISWDITDNARNEVITENRISENGTIFTPSYKDACTLLNTITDATLIGNKYMQRVRIGGLILKATFTLGEYTKTITFNCSTCSKYITNQEVIGYAQQKAKIVYKINTTEVPITYSTETSDASTNSHTIVLPSSLAGDKLYIGLPCTKTATESYTIDELQLGIDQVNYTFSHKICEFGKPETSPYDDISGIFSNTEINDTIREDDSTFSTTRWVLAVDVNKVKQLSTSDKKQFTIATNVTASYYSKDGISEIAGGEVSTTLYCHIKLNDTAIPVPSESVSNGGE